jgi:hypothetical protein
LSPLVAAERNPSSLDEEAESSSELIISRTSLFDFFWGGGVPLAAGASRFLLRRWIVLTERSSSRLNRDSGGGLRPPCFTAPRFLKAFLYHAAFSSSARLLFSSVSRKEVRIPESASYVHDSISAIMVGQHERLNNSIRKGSGKPWSRRTFPTYAGKFLFIIRIICSASGLLGTTAWTLPITSLDWWISASN